MHTTILSHQALFRAGSESNGCTVAERTSSDFLINGESLLHAIVKADGGHDDFMGCFVKGFNAQNETTARKLKLLTEPKNPVLLYICPECGDIGCGAYSAQIVKTDSGYIWENFAYENGYEEPRIIENIGPFLFEPRAYEAAIDRAAVL